ncbi:MAG: nucleotidyltransferase family protein [Eubacterium sp.]|nr:nucleotidyltransferase family protein [Eubacterium sp.]
MKAIILAAGYATRLYPLTENFPKPLLLVGGKPILDWLTEDIEVAVDEIIVVSNHKFASHFEEWAKDKIKIKVIDDGTSTNETRLGAVRDIYLAVDKHPSKDGYLVMAGDNVLDFSLIPFVEFAKNSGTSCIMCHEETSLPALQKTAVITVDEDNLITSYEEKPKEPKGTLAVPPFYFYRAVDISRIPEALENGCNADAPGSFAAWLSAHTSMHAWRMIGNRHDIGDLKSYEAVRDTYPEDINRFREE